MALGVHGTIPPRSWSIADGYLQFPCQAGRRGPELLDLRAFQPVGRLAAGHRGVFCRLVFSPKLVRNRYDLRVCISDSQRWRRPAPRKSRGAAPFPPPRRVLARCLQREPHLNVAGRTHEMSAGTLTMTSNRTMALVAYVLHLFG